MNLSTRGGFFFFFFFFLAHFDSYGLCFLFIALVERISPTRACDSQRNREALYSPFVPLQYKIRVGFIHNLLLPTIDLK